LNPSRFEQAKQEEVSGMNRLDIHMALAQLLFAAMGAAFLIGVLMVG
jgi:hypothetical protein